METKKCSICEKDLPKTDEYFASRYDRKEPQFQSSCRECHKEYRKQHYNKNQIKYIAKAKIQTKKMTDWFIEMKKVLKCRDCNEDRYWVLDFHHLDPKEKDIEVSYLVRNSSKKKVLEEIKKCVVLCANCHRDLHHKEKIASVA